MRGVRMLSDEIVFTSNGMEKGREMRPETCTRCKESYENRIVEKKRRCQYYRIRSNRSTHN
jgi:hypothetical protein